MLKLKKEETPGGAERRNTALPERDSLQSILARRIEEARHSSPSGVAQPDPPSPWRKLATYLGVPLLVIAGLAWANSTWHFLPLGSDPAFGLPDKWVNENGTEAAMIECAVKARSAGGKRGFQLTAYASSGRVPRGGRMNLDTTGTCHVQVLDPDGVAVLEQDMPLRALVPS